MICTAPRPGPGSIARSAGTRRRSPVPCLSSGGDQTPRAISSDNVLGAPPVAIRSATLAASRWCSYWLPTVSGALAQSYRWWANLKRSSKSDAATRKIRLSISRQTKSKKGAAGLIRRRPRTLDSCSQTPETSARLGWCCSHQYRLCGSLASAEAAANG